MAFECKSEEGPGAYHKNYALGASEAARMKESVHADYAVLVLVDPPLERALDFELETHGVALWTADDFCALLVANANRPIAWPNFLPLLKPGRRSGDIVEFCHEHAHGAWQRAHIAVVYAYVELFAYQRSLVTTDLPALRVQASVDLETLTYMVNERLAKEGDTGRLGVEDIRQAVGYLSAPTVGAVRVADDGSVVAVSECRVL
ncbi:MAG: hypothetical protein GIW99_09715 [Candidatus Eremiobacteraeota bacterium]|nr:hypothetical protein [Candidatus Eremiobacteraeota bacterium]